MKTVVKVCLALATTAWLLLPDVALACEKCFGAGTDTATTRGISMAMLALLALTGLIGGGIGMFFVHVHKRARLLEPGDLMVTEDGDILARHPDTL